MLIRVAGLGFRLVGLRISKRDGSESEQGDMLGRRPVFGTLVRQATSPGVHDYEIEIEKCECEVGVFVLREM